LEENAVYEEREDEFDIVSLLSIHANDRSMTYNALERKMKTIV